MLDLDRRAALHTRTRLAPGPQPPPAQLTYERHVAARIAEPAHFLVQRRAPQVRVLDEPLPHVWLERLEHVRQPTAPYARLPPSLHVRPNRLPVPTKVTSDRADRPPPTTQSSHVHELLLCKHQAGPPPLAHGFDTASVRGGPAVVGLSDRPDAHQLGNFDDRSGEFRRSPSVLGACLIAQLALHAVAAQPLASARTMSSAASAKTTVQMHPEGLTGSAVPLIICPTSFPISPAPTPTVFPSTTTLRVGTALSGSLAAYADTQGYVTVIAPRGWRCSAGYGVDGSGGLRVAPRGSAREGIVASETSACSMCTTGQACALLPRRSGGVVRPFSCTALLAARHLS